MEEYHCSHLDISVPKAPKLLAILLFILAAKCKLNYGYLDTLNSKIHAIMIILSQNREKQRYVSPSYLNFSMANNDQSYI